MPTEKKQVRDFLLLVDTNAIWSNDEDVSAGIDLLTPEFRRKWEQMAKPGDAALAIPDVVMGELAYQKYRQMLKAHQEARATLANLRAALPLGIPEIPELKPVELRSILEGELRGQVNATPHCTTTPIPYAAIAKRIRTIVDESVWRLPPFEHGRTEKGFRDAILLETVRSVHADQPHRDVALISRDNRLREAVHKQFAGASNFGLFASLDDYGKFLELARGRFTPEFLHAATEAAPIAFKEMWESSDIQQRLVDAYNLKMGQLALDPEGGSTGQEAPLAGLFAMGGTALRCVGAPEFHTRDTRLLSVVGSDEFHWSTGVLIVTPYAEPRGLLSPEPASNEASRYRGIALDVEWSARVQKEREFSERKFLRQKEIISRYYATRLLAYATITALASLL